MGASGISWNGVSSACGVWAYVIVGRSGLRETQDSLMHDTN